MSGELFIDTEALFNHARGVRALGDKAAEAKNAAHQVAFNPKMFGSIGSMLVGPFMDPLQLAGVASTEASEECFTSTAEIIDGLAKGFRFIDNTVGTRVDAVGKAIR